MFRSFSGTDPFFYWISLSWNLIWWTLRVNPRRLQMSSSALVHMAVKYWKFRGSKYNWETVSGQRKGLFSCWVPWGTSLMRFASVGAGSGGSCSLSLLPSHLRSPSPASLAPGNDVLLPLLCWGAGQLGWFGFPITLKPGVFRSLKPCRALLLVLSHHPMASMVSSATVKEGNYDTSWISPGSRNLQLSKNFYASRKTNLGQS